MTFLAVSCYKLIPASDVVGSWQAVHEDWTIETGGKTATVSYDAASDPADDFAFMRLYHTSFYVMSSGNNSTAEKSMQMDYSDRFSPLVSGTTRHAKSTMSVRLRKQIISDTGGDARWVVNSVDKQKMVIDYDSGTIDVDGVEVRRKCRIEFKRVLGRG